MPESWSESPAFTSRSDEFEPQRRFDRLVSAGRQLVDGVSGARPGSRSGARSATRSDGRRPRLDGLGRWVENKLDWILEDDDDWREPWQETRPETRPEPSPPVPSRRRPLDAISRRTTVSRPTSSRPKPAGPDPFRPEQFSPADPSEWPDDEAFTVPRWQRQASSARSASRAAPPAGGLGAGDGATPGRALPRSTRRR